ncbi:PREDICTED: uncharacterized protein LOC105455927 isoform X2 [Wasmannia auropunctata]|uniref:uncharacterized protein LOC105455927 isoform X2 n=1 Tax=Wasmannia auropunctata TaxID=64793 RepID=UPI0005ED72ED|nr:PREDICTED: uncharacterized protein LOC105455927 isoform X2 [Wasmannia auropunctata]
MEAELRRLKCPMCFFSTVIPRSLTCHYVRNHRFDPHFTVRCVVAGCTATFMKWCSFKKHVLRKHRNSHDNLLRDVPFQYEPNVYEMENNILQPENDNMLQPNIEMACEINETHDLNWHIMKFLLFVRNYCKTSQTAIENVASGLQHFIKQLSLLLLNKLRQNSDPESGFITNEKCFEIIEQTLLNNSWTSYNNYNMNKFLMDNLNMIPPKAIQLSRTLLWKYKPKLDLIEKKSYGYYLSLLSSLQRLLANEQVRYCVDNPKNNGNVMKSVLDGDTPASAFLGGFKMSVSADKPCRRCMTNQDRWKRFFTEKAFTLRNMESHLNHLEIIEGPEMLQTTREYWKTNFGVNTRSMRA